MPPKPNPTHFLCIPLAEAQLARSLASFRADVTSLASFSVPGQAVRPLGTLHLTLGVMSLKDESVNQAVDLLKGLRLNDILEHAKASSTATDAARRMGLEAPSQDAELSITLRGLHAMQTASKTSVLYTPPTDPSGLLRRFCERLRQVFLDAGLMAEEQRPLLLHATIVNTIYVKGQGRGRGGAKRLTIDARDIISCYEDFVWAEDMPVRRVALCRMGAKKIEGSDGDEAYEVEAEVGFDGL